MTNDDRTGAFWERHDKLMQDPEHEARFNTELARIRAVDAQVNAADDLRTALTKLAEKWEAVVFGDAVADDLRALLAAHPAPAPVSDARREDVAQAVRDAIDQSYTFEGDLDPDVDRRVTDAVLAVLPAPPVDDGGWTVADWEEWANEVAATLPEDCDGDEAQVEIIAKFVRRAAAPPVVDEAEIAEAILARYSSFDPLTAQGIANVVAARLRGATR